jgi:ankyrin repeat protein
MFRDGPDTRELVDLLLGMGAPINEVQYKNHPQAWAERSAFALGTPLHYAAEEDKPELVSYLLRRGADPSIRDSLGLTALETAKLLGKPNVVEILQSALI